MPRLMPIAERRVIENVFDWLDEVRARPGMYLVPDGSLRELLPMVYGYYAALDAHGLVEPVPQMASHFADWLRYRKRWSSLNLGWGRAIEMHTRPPETPLDHFFRLVDEYRVLRPVSLWEVTLTKRHQPTGKGRFTGDFKRLPAPLRIEVVQYQPKPLHFVRLHYPNGPEDGWVMFRADGRAGSAAHAKQWVELEFQVRPEEWKAAPAAGGRANQKATGGRGTTRKRSSEPR